MPTPVESELVSTPSPVGPIALWRAAMITKYDLMMIEFDRAGKSWTIKQRSKHYSVTRMILRDRPQSVKFMLVVTEPPNVSTREVIKISRGFTGVTALSYGARAPIELVPRQGWLKNMKTNPTKPPPPVLPTPRRVNKSLIVETDESGKEVDVKTVHDEVMVIAENQNNEASSSSSGNKVDKNETPNQCDETSEVTNNVNLEGQNGVLCCVLCGVCCVVRVVCVCCVWCVCVVSYVLHTADTGQVTPTAVCRRNGRC